MAVEAIIVRLFRRACEMAHMQRDKTESGVILVQILRISVWNIYIMARELARQSLSHFGAGEESPGSIGQSAS